MKIKKRINYVHEDHIGGVGWFTAEALRTRRGEL
jgi:hypothetical protein